MNSGFNGLNIPLKTDGYSSFERLVRLRLTHYLYPGLLMFDQIRGVYEKIVIAGNVFRRIGYLQKKMKNRRSKSESIDPNKNRHCCRNLNALFFSWDIHRRMTFGDSTFFGYWRIEVS